MSTLTNEEAEKLLMLPKKIIVDDELLRPDYN